MTYYGLGHSDNDDKYIDRKYKGHKKGYSYEGNGYYSNLHGGTDMYWDEQKNDWARSL